MNRSNVEEIKARLPIEEIIGGYMKLDKAGKSWKGRCPFHNEKSPSFFVSPDRGGYYCFGCNAKGDIFTFVEQFEGLDFRGALKVLAEKAGVQLTFDNKADGERESLYKIMEEATRFFEAQLEKSKEARDYVAGRGISEETKKIFRIGLAPEGWRHLSVHLKSKGFSDALMLKAGLTKQKDMNDMPVKVVGETPTLIRPASATSNNAASSTAYDRFRGRIMFPISDSSGRVIAFSGRILKDDGKSPKYLNSPDMPLYDKSLVLYGLDKAKNEIRRMGYTILVEGQMDLVMSHQAGIKNTVASSGTALTEEASNQLGVISNLGLVRRLSPNAIIAFDSDAAGKKAAIRAAGIALGLAMDVKIADIIGGKDPADLVKEDVEKWKDILRTAKPVVEFELDNVLKEVTESRKLAKAIAERVLPLVVRIESNSDQSFFVQMIGEKAKLPLDIIWQDLKIIEKRMKQGATNQPLKQVAKMSSEQVKRIDVVERRLFGLIYMMEKEKDTEVEKFRDSLKKIAGDSYDLRSSRAQLISNDLLFEAESFFGQKPEEWKKHAQELLMNFEEDLLTEELVRTMQELKVAEKAQNIDLLNELAKKCQVLSIRKAEIGKRRKV